MIALALAVAATTPAAPVEAQVVEKMFAAFNRHDPAAMAALYAPDARLTSSDFCAARTGRDVTRTYAALFAEMPDVVDTVDTLLVNGERVAVRFTATSAKARVTIRIMSFLRVRGGRIVEDDSIFDTGGRPCAP